MCLGPLTKCTGLWVLLCRLAAVWVLWRPAAVWVFCRLAAVWVLCRLAAVWVKWKWFKSSEYFEFWYLVLVSLLVAGVRYFFCRGESSESRRYFFINIFNSSVNHNLKTSDWYRSFIYSFPVFRYKWYFKVYQIFNVYIALVPNSSPRAMARWLPQQRQRVVPLTWTWRTPRARGIQLSPVTPLPARRGWDGHITQILISNNKHNIQIIIVSNYELTDPSHTLPVTLFIPTTFLHLALLTRNIFWFLIL